MSNFLSHGNVAQAGDTCVVYCTFANIYSIKLAHGEVFQTKYGALKHDDVIGRTYGTKVLCSCGYVYVLRVTPELWTLTLPHRTQILYTRDISLVTLQLDLKPGSVVCEAGTGSGSMTHALARTVAPNGHVYTFDFHEHRAQVAQKEFQEHGLNSVVTCAHRDICQDGFGIEGLADAVFLDLPHPWKAVDAAASALKPGCGGRLCSFSPCVEQVQRTCEALRGRGFVDVVTLECLERPYEMKQVFMADIRDACRVPSGGPAPKKEHATAKTLGTTEGDAMTGVEEPSESLVEAEGGAEVEAKATDDTNRGKKRRGHQEDLGSANPVFCFQAAIPSLQIPGHTGYLTFATLLAS
ncbi:tRNA methyltransferase 61 [Rhipicephalus microplus]|uniref:tRNA methyltransferase 61 n=1 Tax=Rhipicephalus microplus TaxID=6941 RepID=UPI003F6BE873